MATPTAAQNASVYGRFSGDHAADTLSNSSETDQLTSILLQIRVDFFRHGNPFDRSTLRNFERHASRVCGGNVDPPTFHGQDTVFRKIEDDFDGIGRQHLDGRLGGSDAIT